MNATKEIPEVKPSSQFENIEKLKKIAQDIPAIYEKLKLNVEKMERLTDRYAELVEEMESQKETDE